MNKPTYTSKKGVQFIAGWEGWRANCYDDAAGNCTIGYGHLVHLGKTSLHDTAQWGTISREKGLALLAADLMTAERSVLEHVRPQFAWQSRFDAIVSFVFNVGTGAFERSTLLKLLNAGRLRRGAADELLKWDHAGGHELPGLLNRRRAERTMFLYGRY